MNCCPTSSMKPKPSFPQTDICKRTARWNRIKDFSNQPDSLVDLRNEHPWTHTTGINPQPFMFYESQDIRIIAFATDDNLGFLAQKVVHGWKLCHGTTPVPPALHELDFEFGPPGTVTTTKSFTSNVDIGENWKRTIYNYKKGKKGRPLRTCSEIQRRY